MVAVKELGLNSPILKEVRKIARSKSYRIESNKTVAEGHSLVLDLISLQLSELSVEIDKIIVSDKEVELVGELINLDDKVGDIFVAPERFFDTIKLTKNSPGVLAIVKTKNTAGMSSTDWLAKQDFPIFAFYEIESPLNLGAVSRSLLSFGITNLVLIGRCCELYSPNTVRSSMGAVFQISTISFDSVETKN